MVKISKMKNENYLNFITLSGKYWKFIKKRDLTKIINVIQN